MWGRLFQNMVQLIGDDDFILQAIEEGCQGASIHTLYPWLNYFSLAERETLICFYLDSQEWV